jgi:hypothetical protein
LLNQSFNPNARKFLKIENNFFEAIFCGIPKDIGSVALRNSKQSFSNCD